jgi:hypothetical protein
MVMMIITQLMEVNGTYDKKIIKRVKEIIK